MTRCVSGSRRVDLFDQVHREHVAGRVLGELVGAVARPDRHRECVDPGALDELDRLIGVGQVHLAGAVAVLDPAERAQLALDADAARVRILDHLAGDGTLYSKSEGVLPSASSEPSIITLVKPSSIAEMQVAGRVAVVLVQCDRDLRVELAGGLHQVEEEAIVRVGARAA